VFLNFPAGNPGFDGVIVSPVSDIRTHLTFIESRYSATSSGKYESLNAYQKKYDLVLNDVSLLRADLSDLGMSFDWHYVYGVYRKSAIKEHSLKCNTVFMGRDGLDRFYGPSLSGLCML
jgi:hypothetical protein